MASIAELDMLSTLQCLCPVMCHLIYVQNANKSVCDYCTLYALLVNICFCLLMCAYSIKLAEGVSSLWKKKQILIQLMGSTYIEEMIC